MGLDSCARYNRKKKSEERQIIWGWGWLEADFQRFYQIDLNFEVYQNGMSNRRFMNLLKGIPPESGWGYFLRQKDNRDLVQDFINV